VIVRKRPNTLVLFFSFQGSIVRKIAVPVLMNFLFACGVLWYSIRHPAAFHNFAATPFALFGIGISIFIAFRNTSAYDRWYEARKSWGGLLIEARSFARTAITLLSPEASRVLVRRTIAFTYALNAHLRRNELPAEVRQYLSAEEFEVARGKQNLPNFLLEAMATDLTDALRRGELPDILFKALDEHVNAFAYIQGGCERILNTPTPFTYTLLLHRVTILLCTLLPFGLVSGLGYVSPLICILVTYSLLGIDALCDELEQPFGENPNALPLNAISRTIEIDLLHSLDDETDLQHLHPKAFLLD
jgi:putative membrane protein